jgi:hypothetical protein
MMVAHDPHIAAYAGWILYAIFAGTQTIGNAGLAADKMKAIG